MKTLALREKNCFAEVRFILAFIVLVAHTSNLATSEELYWFTKYFDSGFAVKGFFAISGYLVTKSYISSDSFFHYFEKRIRRVYPAYIIAIAYCVLVGFFTTNLPISEFFFNSGFISYLAANLTFLNFMQPNLPGAIPFAKVQALNGSLWTIKVELMLYLTVPFLFFMLKRVGMYMTLGSSFIFGIAWYLYFSQYFSYQIGESISRQFPGQLPFFAFGGMLGFIRFNKISTLSILSICIVYFLIFKNVFGDPVREIISMFIYPLTVILIAKSRILNINMEKYGDFSYGIYLFHFPTIQMLEHFGLYKISPYVAFFTSIFVTIFLSMFSWHVVEQRFVKRSSNHMQATKTI